MKKETESAAVYAQLWLLLLLLLGGAHSATLTIATTTVGSPATAAFRRQRQRGDEKPLAFLAKNNGLLEMNYQEDSNDDNDNNSNAGHGNDDGNVPAHTNRNNYWPPWPFSALSAEARSKRQQQNRGGGTLSGSAAAAAAGTVWQFSKTSAQVGFRNLQEIGAQLWFHVPPAAPPLVVLAMFPRREGRALTVSVASTTPTTAAAAAGVESTLQHFVYRIPLFSNAFVRNLALSAFGLTVVSWAHSELQRKRNLTPLALVERYRDVNRAVLPPFLPDEVSVQFLQTLKERQKAEDEEEESRERAVEKHRENSSNYEMDESIFPPRLRRHWKQFQENAPKPRTLRRTFLEWRRMREITQAERQNAHRLAIYDELVALQALKKKSKVNSKDTKKPRQTLFGSLTASVNDETKHDSRNNESLGYALVTGASKGIGRAIAVELARWEIPLILVARDVDALTSLAYDLEACYGVDCCVLAADLSRPETAERIYDTVKDAGMNVDVSVYLSWTRTCC
jgi:short chain dehydrogenase